MCRIARLLFCCCLLFMQARGDWNPPGLQGLLQLLSAISPLPLLPPSGLLLPPSKTERMQHQEQSEVRTGDRRSEHSAEPQNVQLKGIGPKALAAKDIHRSLPLTQDQNKYSPHQFHDNKSNQHPVKLDKDSYGFPKSPLKNSYEPPVIPTTDPHESHGPSLKDSQKYHKGIVIDTVYGSPKSPFINSYQSSSVNVSAVLPVTSKEPPESSIPVDSYGSPKAPVQSSYKQVPGQDPVESTKHKKVPDQEIDTYGSPRGPLQNSYQPANQGSRTNGAHEAPLTNSFITVDLKATMPVGIAHPIEPNAEEMSAQLDPKAPSLDSQKLVDAHSALKDLVGTLGTKMAYNSEPFDPQTSNSLSRSDLNVEVASPKYPAGFLGGKPDTNRQQENPKPKAQPRGDRPNHSADVRPPRPHQKHPKLKRRLPRKPLLKKRPKQRPRKLNLKRPKLRPPKLVKVYWNQDKSVKSAKSKRKPAQRPAIKTANAKPKRKKHPTPEKGKAKVEKKPGAYAPPPVIEPTMLGFHPLPHPKTPTSSPTYPPEEFVWQENLKKPPSSRFQHGNQNSVPASQQVHHPEQKGVLQHRRPSNPSLHHPQPLKHHKWPEPEYLDGGFQPLVPSPEWTEGPTDWKPRQSPGSSYQGRVKVPGLGGGGDVSIAREPLSKEVSAKQRPSKIFIQPKKPDFVLDLGGETVGENPKEVVIDLAHADEGKKRSSDFSLELGDENLKQDIPEVVIDLVGAKENPPWEFRVVPDPDKATIDISADKDSIGYKVKDLVREIEELKGRMADKESPAVTSTLEQSVYENENAINSNQKAKVTSTLEQYEASNPLVFSTWEQQLSEIQEEAQTPKVESTLEQASYDKLFSDKGGGRVTYEVIPAALNDNVQDVNEVLLTSTLEQHQKNGLDNFDLANDLPQRTEVIDLYDGGRLIKTPTAIVDVPSVSNSLVEDPSGIQASYFNTGNTEEDIVVNLVDGEETHPWYHVHGDQSDIVPEEDGETQHHNQMTEEGFKPQGENDHSSPKFLADPNNAIPERYDGRVIVSGFDPQDGGTNMANEGIEVPTKAQEEEAEGKGSRRPVPAPVEVVGDAGYLVKYQYGQQSSNLHKGEKQEQKTSKLQLPVRFPQQENIVDTRERQNENETGNEIVRHVTFTVRQSTPLPKLQEMFPEEGNSNTPQEEKDDAGPNDKENDVRHVTFTVKQYFDTPYQSISHSLSNRKPSTPERNPQMIKTEQLAKDVSESLNSNSMVSQLPMRFPQEEEQRDLMTTKGRHSQSLSNLSEKYHSKEEPMRENNVGQYREEKGNVNEFTYTVQQYFDTPYQSISHSLSNRRPDNPKKKPQNTKKTPESIPRGIFPKVNPEEKNNVHESPMLTAIKKTFAGDPYVPRSHGVSPPRQSIAAAPVTNDLGSGANKLTAGITHGTYSRGPEQPDSLIDFHSKLTYPLKSSSKDKSAHQGPSVLEALRPESNSLKQEPLEYSYKLVDHPPPPHSAAKDIVEQPGHISYKWRKEEPIISERPATDYFPPIEELTTSQERPETGQSGIYAYEDWMTQAVRSMENYLNFEDNKHSREIEGKEDGKKILYKMVDGVYQRTLLTKDDAEVSYALVSPTPEPTMRYLGYRRTETYPYLRGQRTESQPYLEQSA